MYPSGEQFMVMKLNNGTQYQELQNGGTGRNANFPYMRIHFKSWRKVFNMGEFAIDKTDEQVFQNHHRMLNSGDLLTNIDSLKIRWKDTDFSLYRKSIPFFSMLQVKDNSTIIKPLNDKYSLDTTVNSILDLIPIDQQKGAIAKAKTLANRMNDYSRGSERTISGIEFSIIEHYNELYRKIAFAIACFMFLFIGAPMGAIVRKGGFGWPILISIIFFVLFLVFALIGERLSQGQVLSPFFGMLFPCFLIFPMGIYLTRKAMNDSDAFNMETYLIIFQKIIKFFKKIKR
jgi:lipopolysaccharide export system permease protein